MKWEAASMRRSAVSQRSRAVAMSPAVGGDAGERVEGEDLDVGVVVAPGLVEDRDETCPRRRRRRSAASIAASRHSPSAACSPPPAARCHARRRFERRPRSRDRRPSARRTRPRWTRASAARRTSPVASALSIASSRVAAPVVVVAGLALRSPEAGDLVRLGLQEAETSRRLRGATDVDDGVVEPVLDAGELAEHRFAANVQPRVVDHAAASARPDRAASTLRSWSPAEIAARAAKSQFAAWSHGRSSPS